MKRVLLVGGGGFVGGHLVEHLQDIGGYDVSLTHNGPLPDGMEGITKYKLNLLDSDGIARVLDSARPDYLVHLAAQSSVALSWKDPALTIDVNVKGTANLLEAVRTSEFDPRILLVGSSEEYGAVPENDNPISEDYSSHPSNPYAVTKVAQEMLGEVYSCAYDMHIMSVRAFNHIGPGQPPIFVIADFCKQVAQIEAGKRKPIIYVGNLAAKRDFTDVDDIVRAYRMLLEHGEPGELYNVGSGHAIAIQNILDTILSMASCDIEVCIDQNRFRPVDISIIEADISKIEQSIGWHRKIMINDTLLKTLDWWRIRENS